MELLMGREKYFIRMGEGFSPMDVAFLMKMHAPKDLDAFNDHLR